MKKECLGTDGIGRKATQAELHKHKTLPGTSYTIETRRVFQCRLGGPAFWASLLCLVTTFLGISFGS